MSSFDSQRAKDSQNAQIAAGVVGGSEGSRHVANVIVGGWDRERRSMERQAHLLPPRDNIVICPAAAREVGAVIGARCKVLGARFIVLGSWFLVIGYWFPEKDGMGLRRLRLRNGFARKG